MITDQMVYLPKRWLPEWLLRWFFIPAVIRSSTQVLGSHRELGRLATLRDRPAIFDAGVLVKVTSAADKSKVP